MQQMQQEPWNAAAVGLLRPTKSAPCSPIKPAAAAAMLRTHSDSFHVAHKVPVGDTPYVRAKRVQVRVCARAFLYFFPGMMGSIRFDLIWVSSAAAVQLVDKDPEKAIALFWSAINAGDRVDSALKDMAIVMKQQNRAEEAIEAIKSLRSRCSDQAQESLDNILLDLYKVRRARPSSPPTRRLPFVHVCVRLMPLRDGTESKCVLCCCPDAQRCGRLDDQISLLKHKLQLIHQGHAFNGKRTKTARSQGRKFQVTLEQEATRLLVSARISHNFLLNKAEIQLKYLVTPGLQLQIHTFNSSAQSLFAADQSCHCYCAG